MRRTTACLLLATALACPPLAAQEPGKASPEQLAAMQAYQRAATPGPAHAGLAMTVGDYTVSIKSWSTPGAEPTVDTGTATRRMLLDGRVVAEELRASMGGQAFNGFGLTGFDNVSGKYWSTWNDSMGTGLTVAEGACDAAARCTMQAHWNDPVTRQRTEARLAIRWESPSVEVFEMYAAGPDGKEMKMMEMTYTRK